MKHDIDLAPVQAVSVTEHPYRRSKTELARIVAAHLHWLFRPELGSIHEPDGTLVAKSIEDLAQAGEALNWFAPHGTSVYWSAVHTHNQRESADEVRAHLKR